MKLSREKQREARRKLDAFIQVPFPKALISELSPEEVRAEAASLDMDLYDAYIAGFVARLSKGEDIDDEYVYINGGLKYRFVMFGERQTQAGSFIAGHLDYLNSIFTLIREVKELAVSE